MNIYEITTQNFEQEVNNSDKPVLIDFWATWCGPCRMMSPIIDQIAGENQDIKVCKVNVDNEPELAKKFRIMSIPTLVVIENGEIKTTSVGLVSKEKVLEMFK